MFRVLLGGMITFVAVLVLWTPDVQAQGKEGKWGSIKGQIVWGGDKLPPNPEAKITTDKVACLAKGPILTDEFVINPKNKGVRWVAVWLADPENAMNAKWKPSSIHPSVKATDVEIDQPCCVFLPRMVGIVEGQTLIVKNSATIAHNFKINAQAGGPALNRVIPPGGQLPVKGFVPSAFLSDYSCTIHPWMKGYIGTFAHPYFAITDADGKFELKNVPAGKQRVLLMHESSWVINSAKKAERGKVVTVEDGKTLDLGEIKLMPSK